jgi:ComF family protein
MRIEYKYDDLFTSAKHCLEAFNHLFFPRLCFGCEEHVIDNNEFFCLNCLSELPFTGFENIRGNAVEKLFWGRVKIAYAFSTVYYQEKTPVQHAVHALKYKNQQKLGGFLGELMAVKSEQLSAVLRPDFLIPMPLHPKKQRMRGYNQAMLLSKGYSNISDIPVLDNVLKRATHTSTQTHKSRIDRWENVSGIFEINDKHLLKDKHVLLIDDVITTGASTEACVSILLEAGVASAGVCSFAFTL